MNCTVLSFINLGLKPPSFDVATPMLATLFSCNILIFFTYTDSLKITFSLPTTDIQHQLLHQQREIKNYDVRVWMGVSLRSQLQSKEKGMHRMFCSNSLSLNNGIHCNGISKMQVMY